MKLQNIYKRKINIIYYFGLRLYQVYTLFNFKVIISDYIKLLDRHFKVLNNFWTSVKKV